MIFRAGVIIGISSQNGSFYHWKNPRARRDRCFKFPFFRKTINGSLKKGNKFYEYIFSNQGSKNETLYPYGVNKLLILWYCMMLKITNLFQWFIINFNQKADYGHPFWTMQVGKSLLYIRMAMILISMKQQQSHGIFRIRKHQALIRRMEKQSHPLQIKAFFLKESYSKDKGKVGIERSTGSDLKFFFQKFLFPRSLFHRARLTNELRSESTLIILTSFL